MAAGVARPILAAALAASLSGCLPMMALMGGGHGTTTGSHGGTHDQPFEEQPDGRNRAKE